MWRNHRHVGREGSRAGKAGPQKAEYRGYDSAGSARSKGDGTGRARKARHLAAARRHRSRGRSESPHPLGDHGAPTVGTPIPHRRRGPLVHTESSRISGRCAKRCRRGRDFHRKRQRGRRPSDRSPARQATPQERSPRSITAPASACASHIVRTIPKVIALEWRTAHVGYGEARIHGSDALAWKESTSASPVSMKRRAVTHARSGPLQPRQRGVERESSPPRLLMSVGVVCKGNTPISSAEIFSSRSWSPSRSSTAPVRTQVAFRRWTRISRPSAASHDVACAPASCGRSTNIG